MTVVEQKKSYLRLLGPAFEASNLENISNSKYETSVLECDIRFLDYFENSIMKCFETSSLYRSRLLEQQ
jgi:hypothetical protein